MSTTKGTPLTLSELRNMIGRQIWVKDLALHDDGPHTIVWAGNRIIAEDATGCYYPIDPPNGYGKTWVAYGMEEKK